MMNLVNVWSISLVAHAVLSRVKDYTPAGSVFPVESYHGFIGVNHNGNDIFYWMFPSQNAPATDPLCVWLNGGPGTSSMFGLLSENGPFLIDDTTSKPVINPSSWNQKCNMIYIDQPVGVAMSHALQREWPETQIESSNTMVEFFTRFMEFYPEFQGRKLFIFGESYGGHYIPYIAEALYNTSNFNLAGIGIGNGYIDVANQYPQYAEYANLPENQNYTKITPGIMSKVVPLFKTCQNLIISSSVLQRDLSLWDFCESISDMIVYDPITGEEKFDEYDIRNSGESAKLSAKQREVKLGNFYNFMNTPEVMNELRADKPWNGGTNGFFGWMIRRDWLTNCSLPLGRLLDNNLNVLIYNGKMDYICNWVGNKAVLDHMNWNGKAAWQNVNQSDYHGYGQVWKLNNLQFVTIEGAGHMVPSNQPVNSLDMFNRFLQNQS